MVLNSQDLEWSASADPLDRPGADARPSGDLRPDIVTRKDCLKAGRHHPRREAMGNTTAQVDG